MSEAANGSPASGPQPDKTQPLTPLLPEGTPWWFRLLRDNWQAIYKEWSSWLIALTGFLAAASEAMPVLAPQLSHYLSDSVMHWLTGICALAALAAKFIKQKA